MKSTFTVKLGSLAGAALAAGFGFVSMPVGAETLVEQVTDTRLVLAFRVDPAELQKVFPGPWDIVGTAAGPAKDANFNVIFYDRMLQQDGAGASMGPPYRFIVFTTVVKPKEASAAASVVSRIYASDPKRVPGPYKNSLLSTVERRTVIESGSSEPGTVDETWTVRAPQNHTINLSVKYEKSAPARGGSTPRSTPLSTELTDGTCWRKSRRALPLASIALKTIVSMPVFQTTPTYSRVPSSWRSSRSRCTYGTFCCPSQAILRPLSGLAPASPGFHSGMS
jgi:hypothetical protein